MYIEKFELITQVTKALEDLEFHLLEYYEEIQDYRITSLEVKKGYVKMKYVTRGEEFTMETRQGIDE